MHHPAMQLIKYYTSEKRITSNTLSHIPASFIIPAKCSRTSVARAPSPGFKRVSEELNFSVVFSAREVQRFHKFQFVGLIVWGFGLFVQRFKWCGIVLYYQFVGELR
ncbi:hypothetical protein JTB14_003862 [Gonioctena quinquepunctata]|nr:hypothetical protein JTB14_003862 [Gonioctena quinquepunctata]